MARSMDLDELVEHWTLLGGGGGGGSGCVVDRDERELIAGKRARRGWVRTVSSLVDRAVGQDQQGARVLRVLGKGEPSRAPRCCPPPRRCTSVGRDREIRALGEAPSASPVCIRTPCGTPSPPPLSTTASKC